MGIQGTNLSSALSSVKIGDPSFTRRKEPVTVKNQSDFFTKEEISYEPIKQVERQEYDVSKTLEKENIQKVNRFVLSLFEQPLTEENKEKVDNVLAEMLKNSKLNPKQKETLKKMVFKAIENYQKLPDDKKTKAKEQFEKMQTISGNNNKVACIAISVLMLFVPHMISEPPVLAVFLMGAGLLLYGVGDENKPLMALGAL